LLNALDRASRYQRSDIQFLRGISIVGVLLFHAWPSVFSNGFLGVDAFFVISGAVMSPKIIRILHKDEKSSFLKMIFQFFRSRFFRLAPAFGVSVTISTVIIFFFGNFSDHSRFAMQAIYSSLLIGNVGAARWSGNYFNPDYNPLVHLWSLSVEEQFYIFIPITAIFLIVLFRFIGFRISNFRRY
jgi:peptidoglycan/LPS O-acetylase OafA/YrhL